MVTQWLKSRKAAQPAFSPSAFDRFVNIMVNATQEMLDTWDHVDKNRDINIVEHIKLLTLKISMQSFFSKSLSKEKAPILLDAITSLLHHVNLFTNRMFNWPMFLPTLANMRVKKETRVFDNFAYNLIQERRGSKQTHGDFLDMIMKTCDPTKGCPMSNREIRDEIVTIFGAGQEAPSNTLNWIFYLLSKHPYIMNKVQNEVVDLLKGKTPQLSDLQRLEYTRMVLKESMRLHPPAWAVDRNNLEVEEIGGYVIPKNSHLL